VPVRGGPEGGCQCAEGMLLDSHPPRSMRSTAGMPRKQQQHPTWLHTNAEQNGHEHSVEKATEPASGPMARACLLTSHGSRLHRCARWRSCHCRQGHTHGAGRAWAMGCCACSSLQHACAQLRMCRTRIHHTRSSLHATASPTWKGCEGQISRPAAGHAGSASLHRTAATWSVRETAAH
jgi:hypothetical protein